MKRDIINIDQDKCNGCGACVPNCPEGALQIINGKAHVVSDLLCDGLGACIGHCPQDAITIEQREAEPYDENKAMDRVVQGGPAVIAAHLAHLKEHGQDEYFRQAQGYLIKAGIPVPGLKEKPAEPCGCPGGRTVSLPERPSSADPANTSAAPTGSELRNWPVQLALINPSAPYFENADIVIAADCVPFTYGNFHQRFLKGRVLIIFCPKLDKSNEAYMEKLTNIFSHHSIHSVTVVHLEVPCCAVEPMVTEALQQSGKIIALKEYTISLQGDII